MASDGGHDQLDYLNESQQRDYVHRTIKAMLDNWNEDPGDHRLSSADFDELWQPRFAESPDHA